MDAALILRGTFADPVAERYADVWLVQAKRLQLDPFAAESTVESAKP